MNKSLFFTFILTLSTSIIAQTPIELKGNGDILKLDTLQTIDSNIAVEPIVVTDSINVVTNVVPIDTVKTKALKENTINIDTLKNNTKEVVKPEKNTVGKETTVLNSKSNVDSLQNVISKLQQQLKNSKNIKPIAQFHKQEPAPTLDEEMIKELYEKALKTHMKREYRKSISMMTDLLVNYPTSTLACNFQYWIGEGLFLLKDYNGAIDAFKKVFNYPTNNYKLDDAQYMLGKSNMFLGNNQQASIEFETFLMKYPESEYVKKANKLLKKVR